MENLCLHCDCCGHHLEITYDQEFDYVYLSAEVKARGFWTALKEAWKLFHGVRKGCYEEVILNKHAQEQLYNFLRHIDHCRMWNTDRKEGR